MGWSRPDAGDQGGVIRVLLAGGHFLFRQALRAALEGEPDIVVVGEAATEGEAIVDVHRWSPDVVVLDATLGAAEAVSAIARVAEGNGRPGVVFIATSSDEPSVADVIEAGAMAYLPKEAALADLIECVRAVRRGEVLIPPPLLASLLADLLDRRRDQLEAFEVLDRLTPREREVLLLLGGEANNRTIARALTITVGTARTHVQNLLGKLGVHSRADAAAFVRRTGLLRTRANGPTIGTTGLRSRSIGPMPALDVDGDGAPSTTPVVAGSSPRGTSRSSRDLLPKGSVNA